MKGQREFKDRLPRGHINTISLYVPIYFETKSRVNIESSLEGLRPRLAPVRHLRTPALLHQKLWEIFESQVKIPLKHSCLYCIFWLANYKIYIFGETT